MEPKAPHALIVELARIQARDSLTGADLARRLQVSPSTITRLMSGDIPQPSLRLVRTMNEQFPELRPICADLLLIGSNGSADQRYPEPAEAVAS